jgi:hypothetical protein
MPLVISQHLLNVFVQLANKRGFKKKQQTLQNINPSYVVINFGSVISQQDANNKEWKRT